MSARKLGRLAGLVFVLVALAGGVAAASGEHGSAGADSAHVISAFQGDMNWD